MSRPIRTLLFSTLYPSAVRPLHGIFVETRLRELLKSGEVEACVMAPVPWFPSSHARWGEYAKFARTPRRELRQGIEVLHPRYPLIPKIGMSSAPLLLAAASVRPIQRLIDQGFDFDLIDAHYFYPDGVAAALLAQHFRKALVITARGSDINQISQHAVPRSMIVWAGRRAGACIGVSQALVDKMRQLGLPGGGLLAVRNGVDLLKFCPHDQPAARQRLNISNVHPLLLSVGNLLPIKGHDVCIRALANLLHDFPRALLVIAGAGPQRDELVGLAKTLGVADHVRLIGAVAHDELAYWYSAADLLLLASTREGWPNVLLEAMACGTPVVASNVGGIPEIICSRSAGRVVDARSASAFVSAIQDLFCDGIDRAGVRRHAERFGWGPSTRAQLDVFKHLVSSRAVGSAS